jgi:hypothetical protein
MYANDGFIKVEVGDYFRFLALFHIVQVSIYFLLEKGYNSGKVVVV